MLNGAESIFAGNLLNVLGDTRLVEELLFIEAAGFVFRAKHKEDIRVYNSLTLENIAEIFVRNVDIGKDFEVWSPACLGTGLLFFAGLLFKTADVFALFKVKVVPETVTNYLNVHIFR